MGTLGAGYLASVHMAQYLLYTLVAAPLLMLGTPEWMVRPIVRPAQDPRCAAGAGSTLGGRRRLQRGARRDARALDRRHLPFEPARLDGARHDLAALGLPLVDAAHQPTTRAAAPFARRAMHLPVPGRRCRRDAARRHPHLRELPALPHLRAGASGVGHLRRGRPADGRHPHEDRQHTHRLGRHLRDLRQVGHRREPGRPRRVASGSYGAVRIVRSDRGTTSPPTLGAVSFGVD